MARYAKRIRDDYDDLHNEALSLAYAIVKEPHVSDDLFASAIDTIYHYSLWDMHLEELPEKALQCLQDCAKADGYDVIDAD